MISFVTIGQSGSAKNERSIASRFRQIGRIGHGSDCFARATQRRGGDRLELMNQDGSCVIVFENLAPGSYECLAKWGIDVGYRIVINGKPPRKIVKTSKGFKAYV